MELFATSGIFAGVLVLTRSAYLRSGAYLLANQLKLSGTVGKTSVHSIIPSNTACVIQTTVARKDSPRQEIHTKSVAFLNNSNIKTKDMSIVGSFEWKYPDVSNKSNIERSITASFSDLKDKNWSFKVSSNPSEFYMIVEKKYDSSVAVVGGHDKDLVITTYLKNYQREGFIIGCILIAGGMLLIIKMQFDDYFERERKRREEYDRY